MIVLYGAAGENLKQSEQHLLETLAAQTSVTLENAHLFEMTLRQGVLLEQRANRLAHILETSYDVLRLRPQTRDLWTQVCHIAQDALGFQIAAIYGLDNQQTLSLRALVGSDSPPAHHTCPSAEFDRLLVPHFRISHSYHVRHSAQAHTDASVALRCLELAGFRTGDDHPEGTLLAPIEAPDGQVVGYLALGEPRKASVPSLETIQAVEIFVNQVAIARENARLFAALEQRLNQARRVNELAALHRLSTAVASSLETEHILHAASAEIARTLQPNVSSIWLLSPQGDLAQPIVVHDESGFVPTETCPLIHPDQLAATIRSGRPLLLDGPGTERSPVSTEQSISKSSPSPFVLGGSLQNALLAPMSVRDQKIGVIGVFARQRGRFNSQDLTLLDSMASTVAMSIENARLYAESKAFSKELAASQAQLIQSAKLAATGQLAASIAHEINNPLQAVQSCVYLIADGAPQDDPNVKYVDIAREELDRIARIVGRMLDFHHPGTEARQATDVNDLIENVLALAHKRLQHSNILVQTDLTPNLPKIQAVGDHIKQVLLNLFLNALEAMPQGGTLQVQTASLHPTDKWVTISIQDDGIGIGQEDLTHLFEPFYTTKSSGTGLGLSISYDIVAQHGGKIEVESEPGRGTTFTIRLPTSTGAQAWNKN
jgi:two-component system NtrC family sensor kinase